MNERPTREDFKINQRWIIRKIDETLLKLIQTNGDLGYKLRLAERCRASIYMALDDQMENINKALAFLESED